MGGNIFGRKGGSDDGFGVGISIPCDITVTAVEEGIRRVASNELALVVGPDFAETGESVVRQIAETVGIELRVEDISPGSWFIVPKDIVRSLVKREEDEAPDNDDT